ncbi:hypothetical protein [Streptomyces sp. NBC_00258]|uniref:hypothetical protein n=1 Tax=Streptomyces sp. NBC_00258 TaxID=2903642 RepID=UPI002E2B3B37|nr:hypothetical protein [Streptomyces sp. NBC_00258]
MAKRKANAAHPRLVPAIAVANVTEIGTSPGVLVIRTGPFTKSPKILTVPGEMADSFVSKLQEAARAAEEEYWDLLPAFRAGAASDDTTELTRAKEKWLLSQPWQQKLQQVLGNRHNRLFFMDYAGHVGIVAATPYAAAPHLLIFDPLQLHRLAPAFQLAAVQVRRNLPTTMTVPAGRLAAAQREWSSVPWPRTPVTPPTPQQADRVIAGLRTDFLRRAPLLKEH